MTTTAPSRQRGILILARDIAIIILAALLISFLIKTFLIRSFYVPSGSMQNTLQVNDRIMVNQLVPGIVPLHHGDVVVFEDPGGWLTTPPLTTPSSFDAALVFVGLAPQDANNHLVKRVIGLPGDTVECCDDLGRLIVNGVAVDEPFIFLPTGVTKAGALEFSVTVPEDSIWVMGDNRHSSSDSSFHQSDPGGGSVPISRVVGRAFVVSWPIAHWSWLDSYSDQYQVG